MKQNTNHEPISCAMYASSDFLIQYCLDKIPLPIRCQVDHGSSHFRSEEKRLIRDPWVFEITDPRKHHFVILGLLIKLFNLDKNMREYHGTDSSYWTISAVEVRAWMGNYI